jgi:membrane protease subunit HflK
MKTIGNALAGGVLAMAGRRSPWGGGDKGTDQPEEGGSDAGDAEGGKSPPETEDKNGDAPKGPRNPWLPPSDAPPRRSATIDDIFRARDPRKGRGGGNFPRMPQRSNGKSWFPIILGVVALVWVGFSMVHMIGPKEQGIVTTFGRYSGTLDSGARLTLPWPIQSVAVTDVTSIKRYTIPENDTEKLMLTSDQNLVDLSYLVRWNIKNLKLYTFQLDDPDATVREVAEAAMRASIAEVPLRDAMGGAGRAMVEQNVRSRMQAILDVYHSGVMIQGVEIKKADPPGKVIGAFQAVTAAQQDAQRDISTAQGWAQQLTAQAQGAATAFDKVYEQYKLAPDVTKRRMYYETMENVLRGNDKVIVASPGITPYMPLPEFRRKPADAQATATPSATQGGGQQ